MSTVDDSRFYREGSVQKPATGNSGCPFCGEPTSLSLYSCGNHRVQCLICFTEGPTGDTPEIAIEAWNTRVRDHLGVRMLMTRDQADRLLSHLCELEQHFDIEPEAASELNHVRRALSDSIVSYDRDNRVSVA